YQADITSPDYLLTSIGQSEHQRPVFRHIFQHAYQGIAVSRNRDRLTEPLSDLQPILPQRLKSL
ncbi:MAG TPA: hypothetical protein DHV57_06100, partial [Hyphomonas sp.]|nr:hypothetical protein [Hyphomonas sp.]